MQQAASGTLGSTDWPAGRSAAAHRRLIASCFIGTTIEWYDFLLYGFLAPTVFDVLFFPRLGPTIGTIAVFGVFAIGFAARPVGGLLFGHFGDRLGRKPVMMITLLLMGGATTAIGLVPTYASIGLAAPVVLVLLRFLQGVALGGETTGGPLLALESAPAGRRGLFASLVQSGAAAGTVLGALAALGVTMLPRESLLAWGWRLPFLASLLIVAVAWYIRVQVEEAPAFTAALAERRAERVPFLAVLARAKAAAAIVFFSATAESSVFYFTAIFGMTYGIQTLHADRGTLLTGVIVGNVIGIAANGMFGALSDRIGRRPLVATAYTLAALYVLTLFFPLIGSGDPLVALVAMAIPGALLQPMSLAVNGSFYAELFDDARLRFSGVSLGKQVGTIAGGGLMPLVSASILAANGNQLWMVLAYFATLCGLALLAVLLAPETRHRTV